MLDLPIEQSSFPIDKVLPNRSLYMGDSGGDRTVTCIACGAELPRSTAREYDKYGDRWGSEGESLEYLCTRCHQELNKQPRETLEINLENAGAGEVTNRRFFELFLNQLAEDDVESEPED